jgi:hypothetical protein
LARTRTWYWFKGFRQIIADTLPFDNAFVATEVFPEGELDADLQQVDLRKQIVGA